MSDSLLNGIRVLDLTRVWAGPFAGQLLAFMGAQVIKVESTTYVDIARFMFIPQDGPGEQPWNRGGYFHIHNINKYSSTLDLQSDEGKELFRSLVGISDVVIENYTPRVMKNFGLDYPNLKQVKPDIIMVSMPGYGSTGPYRDLMAYGEGIEPNSGLSSITGYPDGPPMRSGNAYSDPIAGYNAAFAALVALHYRRRTGKGQHVDVSHVESLSRLFGEAILDYTMNGRVQGRLANRHTSMSPHGAYGCRGEDNWVAISVSSDSEWRSLCQVIGSPELAEDPRFANHLSRYSNQDQLNAIIEEWTMSRDKYKVTETLQKAGVSAGPVLKGPELFTDPHVKEREVFRDVDFPQAGRRRLPGMTAKFSRSDTSVRRHSPSLGEHNEMVFRELLGMEPDELKGLEERKIIGTRPTFDIDPDELD